MGVMEKGIPEKMASYVAIVIEDNNKLLDFDNKIIFMEMSAPDDEGRAPIGKRALSATIFLKQSPKALGNFELEEIAKTTIENIETLLPFLRENLDFLNMEASIELSRRYQAVLNQKYLIKAVPFLGMTSLSHKTPLKNIYLTGGMLLAGLGFEGEIISGMNAARSAISQEDTDYGTKAI
jgi:phytoene dehydrogenase-like protein